MRKANEKVVVKKYNPPLKIESKKEKVNSWLSLIITLAILVFILIISATRLVGRAEATNPCQKYCANWEWWGCADWDWRLCHVNPSQSVNLNFNNENSCLNHLGTPHNNETYDSYGLCPVVSPTSTPTPTPTATPSLTPTPTDVLEDKYHSVCREYTCVEVKGEGESECEVDLDCEPEATPSPTPTPSQTTRTAEATPSCPAGQVCGPVCTVPVKPATAIGGERLDKDTVRFNWFPSTDPHNSQTLIYGPAKDQLLYSVFNLPSETGMFEVNGLDTAHWWFQIATWRDACISYSEVVDP